MYRHFLDSRRIASTISTFESAMIFGRGGWTISKRYFNRTLYPKACCLRLSCFEGGMLKLRVYNFKKFLLKFDQFQQLQKKFVIVVLDIFSQDVR